MSTNNHFEPTNSTTSPLKYFLAHTISLPNGLIDEILDLAEYWPYVSHTSPSVIEAQGQMQDDALNRILVGRARAADAKARIIRAEMCILRNIGSGVEQVDECY